LNAEGGGGGEDLGQMHSKDVEVPTSLKLFLNVNIESEEWFQRCWDLFGFGEERNFLYWDECWFI
jgi:hypothetical protein